MLFWTPPAAPSSKRPAARSAPLLVATALVCSFWSNVASGQAAGAVEGLVLYTEPFIPDLRLELNASKPFLVLSLPVHLRIYGDHFLFSRNKSAVSLFVEPQWRPSGSEWRGVGGLRLTQPLYLPLAVLAEGAGLVGTDGSGGLVGAGVGLFDYRWLHGVGWLAVVWRHVWTTEGKRDDFSLDVVYPIW